VGQDLRRPRLANDALDLTQRGQTEIFVWGCHHASDSNEDMAEAAAAAAAPAADPFVVSQSDVEAVQTLLTDLESKKDSIPPILQSQLAWIVKVRDEWIKIKLDEGDDEFVRALVTLLFRTIQWFAMLVFLRWWFEMAMTALQQQLSTITPTDPGIYQAVQAKRRKILEDIDGLLREMPRGIDIQAERAGLTGVQTAGADRAEYDAAVDAIQDEFPSYFGQEDADLRNSLMTREWYSTDMMAALVQKLVQYVKALASGYGRLRGIAIKTVQAFQQEVAAAASQAAAASDDATKQQQARVDEEDRQRSRKLPAVLRRMLEQPTRPVQQVQGPPSTRPVWPSIAGPSTQQSSNPRKRSSKWDMSKEDAMKAAFDRKADELDPGGRELAALAREAEAMDQS
jgi:hypothetical protein